MRNTIFAPGEYYHLFGRGNNKQKICLDKRDYARLLFVFLFFQSDIPIRNASKQLDHFFANKDFHIKSKKIEEIVSKRYVELSAFVIMPNHYHLIVKESTKNGVSRYMQRCLNSYTKYFNKKHGHTGHLFQGPFKAVHVPSNKQLLYLSTYIHRNPIELSGGKNNWKTYEWSSYKDYIDENRWEKLLKNEIILEQFDEKNTYTNFVATSTAKTKNLAAIYK